MANDSNQSTGSGTASLAFILGGVVVALAFLFWVFFGGQAPVADDPDISIELPGVGSVEGEVESE